MTEFERESRFPLSDFGRQQPANQCDFKGKKSHYPPTKTSGNINTKNHR
jgi:hypothetical protein